MILDAHLYAHDAQQSAAIAEWSLWCCHLNWLDWEHTKSQMIYSGKTPSHSTSPSLQYVLVEILSVVCVQWSLLQSSDVTMSQYVGVFWNFSDP